jgi:hypothetical protein
LDLTILNSNIIKLSRSSKTDGQKFRLTLAQSLLEMNAREPHPQSSPIGRPNPQVNQMTHLEAERTEHFPAAGLRCGALCVKSRRNEQLYFSARSAKLACV